MLMVVAAFVASAESATRAFAARTPLQFVKV
jgi:hypothetical protein